MHQVTCNVYVTQNTFICNNDDQKKKVYTHKSKLIKIISPNEQFNKEASQSRFHRN